MYLPRIKREELHFPQHILELNCTVKVATAEKREVQWQYKNGFIQKPNKYINHMNTRPVFECWKHVWLLNGPIFEWPFRNLIMNDDQAK